MAEASTGRAALVALPRRGQIAVRWAAAAEPALVKTLGIAALPEINHWTAHPTGQVLWLGPDELLVTTAESSRVSLIAALSQALGDLGAVVDVSANRIELELGGPASREILAASTAIDLHARAFRPGQLASTLVAHTQVILLQIDEVPTYRLMVRPSFRAYLEDWLRDAGG